MYVSHEHETMSYIIQYVLICYDMEFDYDIQNYHY